MPKKSVKRGVKGAGGAGNEDGGEAQDEDTFQCTLCMRHLHQDVLIEHFKTHHKITKVGAIERLVTLGAAIGNHSDPSPSKGEDQSQNVKLEETVFVSAPGQGEYLEGDLVMAHVMGYPWWPAIVRRMSKPDEVEVRFFDKTMQNGRLKLTDLKPYTSEQYSVYIRNNRKRYPGKRIARIRQAHEVASKLEDRHDASWRHKFFCKEKHSMFDFLAQCDEEEMETNGVKKEAPGVLSEASLDQIDSQQPDAKEVTQTCQTSPDPPPDKKAKMSKKESKRHLGSKTDTPNTQQGRGKSFESKPKEKGDVKGQTREGIINPELEAPRVQLTPKSNGTEVTPASFEEYDDSHVDNDVDEVLSGFKTP